MVKIALTMLAVTIVIHIPLRCHIGVNKTKKTIGIIIVPQNAISNEYIGFSTAVKYDEKHISTHPVKYEIANNSIPDILIAKRFVSFRFTKKLII